MELMRQILLRHKAFQLFCLQIEPTAAIRPLFYFLLNQPLFADQRHGLAHPFAWMEELMGQGPHQNAAWGSGRFVRLAFSCGHKIPAIQPLVAHQGSLTYFRSLFPSERNRPHHTIVLTNLERCRTFESFPKHAAIQHQNEHCCHIHQCPCNQIALLSQ